LGVVVAMRALNDHVMLDKSNIVFYEHLGPVALIYLMAANMYGFYNKKSMLVVLIEKLFRINVYKYARRISWGDLQLSTGIRRRSYEFSKSDLESFSADGFESNFPSLQSIDKKLILDKVYFEERYELHEFYGMASQFSEESHQAKFRLHIDSRNKVAFNGKGYSQKINVISQFGSNKLQFISGAILAPIYILFFLKKHLTKYTPYYKNSIICEVDQPSVANMFCDLFKEKNSVYFVTQKHYVKNFTEFEIAKYKLTVKGISFVIARKMVKLLFEYLTFCRNNFFSVSNYGWLYFKFLRTIVNGYLLTIDGKNCVYVTFEHLNPAKAARNELLRLNHSKSIFVPKNNYITSRYYAPEFKFNYDIFCSPCSCQEMVYAFQNAETKIILRTGIYDSHQYIHRDIDFLSRVNRLKKFKGKSIAITICSNGVQDETLRGEVGLMKLANQLARQHNVKVLIRPKPVTPPLKYNNFFTEYLDYSDSIMLTGDEYLLSDFLGVTDLFITSNSCSVTDLCAAGAEFFSIDFWKDSDQFLWQTVVDGIFLSESHAFSRIMDWVDDGPSGNRVNYAKKMAQLREVISYKFNSFEDYKLNIMNLLTPYLPTNIHPIPFVPQIYEDS
jgi:hypothetical protein